MLKTNSKQARLNIQAYIKNHFDGCSYGIETPDTFKELSKIILDTCYYYNRSAVDDLGAILEETDSEKARYSEQQAETRLTYLIYRELVRGCR